MPMQDTPAQAQIQTLLLLRRGNGLNFGIGLVVRKEVQKMRLINCPKHSWEPRSLVDVRAVSGLNTGHCPPTDARLSHSAGMTQGTDRLGPGAQNSVRPTHRSRRETSAPYPWAGKLVSGTNGSARTVRGERPGPILTVRNEKTARAKPEPPLRVRFFDSHLARRVSMFYDERIPRRRISRIPFLQ
jgi:hypothetical protein